jgi:Protein of unknown function (DUF2800)
MANLFGGDGDCLPEHDALKARRHARLSPSSSEKWLACPGSVQAEDAYPDRPSRYAAEGTAAHSMFEMGLRLGIEPASLATSNTPEDMVEAIEYAIDFINTQRADAALLGEPFEYHPEERVVIDKANDIWGTSDLIGVRPQELIVVDYKHGEGVVVDPENNSQMMLYAVGGRARHGRRRTYRLVIIQPRARHVEGPVREWTVTDPQLDAFLLKVSTAAAATLPLDAPRHAGPHCRWCRAAATCPALRDLVLKTAVDQFGPVPQPKRVPVDDGEALREALLIAPVVELWMRAAREAANLWLAGGNTIPGFKRVAGRRMREWAIPEAQLQATLLAAGFPLELIAPRVLVSPAGADNAVKFLKRIGQVMGSDTYAPFIAWKQSAPTVAPVSDPRPALTTGEEFNNVNSDNED